MGGGKDRARKGGRGGGGGTRYICAPSLGELCQLVTALLPEEGDNSYSEMKLLIVVSHTHIQHGYCLENRHALDENETIIINIINIIAVMVIVNKRVKSDQKDL